ncbi:hypothetical protein LJC63_02025 [Ruminococcaceae bacterium OttesenSCG-928-L11]|nr:hypothetical protein [Ruminococcaceae bacterium OttesenSCG-928-L11]
MHWKWLERIYSALKNLYCHLFCIITFLGCVGLIAALAAPYPEASAAQHIYRWLGCAMLCLVPMLTHYYSAAYLMLGECFTACVGFLASGAAYLVIWLYPPLNFAMITLPMVWLYHCFALILNVILPFVLWLVILVVVWRGRRSPYGEVFFGHFFPEKLRSPAEWLKAILLERRKKKINKIVAAYSIKSSTEKIQSYRKETKTSKKADNRFFFEALDVFSCEMGLFVVAGYWSGDREVGLMEIINLNGKKLKPFLKEYSDLPPGDILEDYCFLESEDATAMYKADKKRPADLVDIDEIASDDVFKDARTLDEVEALLGCPILERPEARDALYIHIEGDGIDDI